MRGWEKILHANRKDKKEGTAIPLTEKTDFKDKGQYMMIQEPKPEDFTLVNIYTPNKGAPKYIKD